MFILTEKIDFSETAFAFTATPCEIGGCGRPYPDITV